MIIIGNSNTTVAATSSSNLCESSVDTGNKIGVLEKKLHSFRDISPSTRTLITVRGPFEIYGPRVRTNCRKIAKIMRYCVCMLYVYCVQSRQIL